MSLVAYGSSDEGSENEEDEPTKPIIANNDTDGDATETVIMQINTKLSLPAPRVVQQSTNNEDEEEENDGIVQHNFQHFLSALPKPRDPTSTGNVEEEEDDILLKKETKSQIPQPAKRQTVKISVPSLSDFKDLEEEEEESEKKPAKVIQTSQKGCGLFALLTAPKKETERNKILIPQTVKNSVAKNVQQSKVTKKSNTIWNDSKVKKPTSDKLHNELSSDEEDTIDFFGLAASTDMPGSSMELSSDDLTHRPSVEASLIKSIEDSNSSSNSDANLTNDLSSDSSKMLISNVINLPKEEILLKNKTEVGPKLPIPEQEYNVDVEGNVAFDEKAIEYLCGKRGVKRKELEEADIIEISGEDIKPDEREWLVKALTEETVHRPVSMQSGGVSSQSKKKHQITYLAHQAKAMELELKNQWAQNKMARKQAKSKYGF